MSPSYPLIGAEQARTAAIARIAAHDQAIALLGAGTAAGGMVVLSRKAWTDMLDMLDRHRAAGPGEGCGRDGTECAMDYAIQRALKLQLTGDTLATAGHVDVICTLVGRTDLTAARNDLGAWLFRGGRG